MYSFYIRRTDGSPAVRLGDGLGSALSPDAKWVVSTVHGAPSHVVVWPTGPGSSRVLPDGGLIDQQSVSWMPDGRSLVFMATSPGRPPRLYIQDAGGASDPRPVSAEGIQIPLFAKPVSPDGQTLAGVDAQGRVVLQRMQDGSGREVAGLERGDVPLRWTADGRGLYVFRFGEMPGRVHRFSLETAARELVAQLMPADPAGVGQMIAVQITPDGRNCAYSYKQNLADLFLVSGVR
jgi:hypothetical protein